MSRDVQKRPDRIVVRGLEVQTFIGVLDEEHGVRQGVRFDIEIEAIDDYAAIVKKTGRYVSYADVVDYILSRAATDEHVELVETWAEDVATFVLKNDLAAAVTVSVGKTDIFPAAEAVGIVITRHR